MADRYVKAIESAGILLVYPIKNEPDPPSLWSKLYPRSKMSWDWSGSADDRVVDLWHQRTELSTSRDVVYAKWFRGRATFFSLPVFTAALRLLGNAGFQKTLEPEARALYELLLEDSTQTPKMLRAALDMQGPLYESVFNRALKQLWDRLLIVGFGEVEEGNFPALAIGATKVMFEDLWDDAQKLSEEEALAAFAVAAGPGTKFYKQLMTSRLRLLRPLPPRKHRSASVLYSDQSQRDFEE